MSQAVKLLDDAWQSMRAALVAQLSPKLQERVNVGAILTPHEADLLFNRRLAQEGH